LRDYGTFLPARDFRIQFGIPKQKREAFALLARVNLAGYHHLETIGIVTPCGREFASLSPRCFHERS
jgi:hypothetical protein